MNTPSGQFQIIYLESETPSTSYTNSGPLGEGVTSSVHIVESSNLYNARNAEILPRLNEREVNPDTLKVQA